MYLVHVKVTESISLKISAYQNYNNQNKEVTGQKKLSGHNLIRNEGCSVGCSLQSLDVMYPLQPRTNHFY